MALIKIFSNINEYDREHYLNKKYSDSLMISFTILTPLLLFSFSWFYMLMFYAICKDTKGVLLFDMIFDLIFWYFSLCRRLYDQYFIYFHIYLFICTYSITNLVRIYYFICKQKYQDLKTQDNNYY